MIEKEERILSAIIEFNLKNGFMPSVREICKMTEIASSSTVHKYLNSLQNKGYIRRDKSISRSIRIVKK